MFAAYGEKKRGLCIEIPQCLKELQGFVNPQLAMPGVIALQTNKFTTYEAANKEMEALNEQLSSVNCQLPTFLIICDDSSFVAERIGNYLWVTYTRCNPSHDIYGINAFTQNKHWGCNGSLVIDARIKPHHAPPVEKVPAIEKKVDRLFERGGSLYGII